jgi:DNA polymerase-4
LLVKVANSSTGRPQCIRVDMDGFYASVEQGDDPARRSRAVSVGHGPSMAWWLVRRVTRPVPLACVNRAIDDGDALMRGTVFVPPRFDVYRAVSRQIHAIFAGSTALIEPLSLDEAYLDLTQDWRGLHTV